MKILLADDDEDQLAVRRLLLEHHGFTCISAGDADSAWDIAAEQKPDVAVIDVRLPKERDGLNLIARMKANFPTMHLIVLTGADPERVRLWPEVQLADKVVVKGGACGNLVSVLNLLQSRTTA